MCSLWQNSGLTIGFYYSTIFDVQRINSRIMYPKKTQGSLEVTVYQKDFELNYMILSQCDGNTGADSECNFVTLEAYLSNLIAKFSISLTFYGWVGQGKDGTHRQTSGQKDFSEEILL